MIQPEFGRAEARARAASDASDPGRPPIPETTVKFAATTAPSRPCSANGVRRPVPAVQGTTTPSATERMCPGSTPTLAPQW